MSLCLKVTLSVVWYGRGFCSVAPKAWCHLSEVRLRISLPVSPVAGSTHFSAQDHLAFKQQRRLWQVLLAMVTFSCIVSARAPEY